MSLDLTQEKIRILIEEVITLRTLASLRDTPTNIQELHTELLTVRRALDRLSEIVSNLILQHSASVDLVAEATFEYEQAWASAMTKVTATVNEPAPRERYAMYDIQCIPAKMKQMQAEKNERTVKSLLDYAREASRNVDGWRRDLHQLLTSHSRATALES